MAMDLSWVVCEDCGRKPSDRRENEPVISFTLSDPILCGHCHKRKTEYAVPEMNGAARRILGNVLQKLTPLAVAYTVHQEGSSEDPVMVSKDNLRKACEAMKAITLMVYGPNPKEME